MAFTYADDLDAINRFMRTTPIKPLPNGKTNAEAFQIKDAFIRWYDNLGYLDKNATGQTVYDEARTRRNQFNIANAVTPQAKADVRDVIMTGVSTEEMKGKEKPIVDGATGRVGTQVKKPTVAPTPSAMPNANTPKTGVTRQTLVIGTRGPDVDVWQKFVGISPTTGYYGEATAGKTRNWQTAWNNSHPGDKISVDGKVGPQTWMRAFPETQPTPSKIDQAFAPSPTPLNPNPSKPKPQAAKPSSGSSKPASPAPKTPVQPSSGGSKTAQAATKAKTATKKAAAKIAQAGMFDVGSWPLWAKVGAAITIVGGIIAAATGQHQKPRAYLGARRED